MLRNFRVRAGVSSRASSTPGVERKQAEVAVEEAVGGVQARGWRGARRAARWEAESACPISLVITTPAGCSNPVFAACPAFLCGGSRKTRPSKKPYEAEGRRRRKTRSVGLISFVADRRPDGGGGGDRRLGVMALHKHAASESRVPLNDGPGSCGRAPRHGACARGEVVTPSSAGGFFGRSDDDHPVKSGRRVVAAALWTPVERRPAASEGIGRGHRIGSNPLQRASMARWPCFSWQRSSNRWSGLTC